MKKKKEKKYNIFGVMFLIVVLGLVTYAFINYTKKEVLYDERPGNIIYSLAPTDEITLVNVNPIKSSEIDDNISDCQSITVLISGKTNYDEDVEYLIGVEDVNNTINGKNVPLSYAAFAYEFGNESNDYFNERNQDRTIYQLNEEGLISKDTIIMLGYIKKGESNLNGTLIITSYIDSSKISSFGDEAIDEIDQVVFTPEEWDEVINKGVSFKVKVDIRKGIWVK